MSIDNSLVRECKLMAITGRLEKHIDCFSANQQPPYSHSWAKIWPINAENVTFQSIVCNLLRNYDNLTICGEKWVWKQICSIEIAQRKCPCLKFIQIHVHKFTVISVSIKFQCNALPNIHFARTPPLSFCHCRVMCFCMLIFFPSSASQFTYSAWRETIKSTCETHGAQ